MQSDFQATFAAPLHFAARLRSLDQQVSLKFSGGGQNMHGHVLAEPVNFDAIVKSSAVDLLDTAHPAPMMARFKTDKLMV